MNGRGQQDSPKYLRTCRTRRQLLSRGGRRAAKCRSPDPDGGSYVDLTDGPRSRVYTGTIPVAVPDRLEQVEAAVFTGSWLQVDDLTSRCMSIDAEDSRVAVAEAKVPTKPLALRPRVG